MIMLEDAIADFAENYLNLYGPTLEEMKEQREVEQEMERETW